VDDLIDLDAAAVEIERRAEAWGAAGLEVGELTWRDQGGGWPPRIISTRADATDPDSVGVRLRKQPMEASVVLFKGGWADVEFWSGRRDDAPVLDAPGVDQPLTLTAFADLLDATVARFSLVSDVWPAEHLRALGRLVEVSARVEFLARTLLQLALNVPSDVADALFVGSRMSQLTRMGKAVLDAESAPEWASEARDWLDRAHKAIGRRDEIVHRPPSEIVDGHSRLPAMAPARQRDKTELLAKVVPLVQNLVELEREAGTLLGQVIGPAGGHIELGGRIG
jgi:hypothetical protein